MKAAFNQSLTHLRTPFLDGMTLSVMSYAPPPVLPSGTVEPAGCTYTIRHALPYLVCLLIISTTYPKFFALYARSARTWSTGRVRIVMDWPRSEVSDQTW